MKNEGSSRLALKLLKSVGGIITDSHIVYTSGKHGSTYVNKDAIYPYTREISRLCKIIAQHFVGAGVEVVIAPAAGGVVLSQWVAYHLTKLTKKDVLAVYADKNGDTGEFLIKRGYDKLINGRQVLVVEDILNTGGSAKRVIEATRLAGATVVGLGVLCNRNNIKKTDVANPPELFSLINLNYEMWEPGECPLCAQNIPISTDLGKRKLG